MSRTPPLVTVLLLALTGLAFFLAVRFGLEVGPLSPPLVYLTETLEPTEVVGCPGDRIPITYQVEVRRPARLAVTVHWIADDDEQPVQFPDRDVSWFYYREPGRFTVRPPDSRIAQLPAGTYYRVVVSGSTFSDDTKYEQLVRILPESDCPKMGIGRP